MTTMTANQLIPDHIIHWEAYDHLYYKGEFDALIRLQKAYVKRHPADAREKLLLADAYMYANKDKQALKILKKLCVKDPGKVEYVEAMVECYEKLESKSRLLFQNNPF